MAEEKWYDEAVRSRAGWRALCCDGLFGHTEVHVVHATAADRNVVCDVCFRSFRRESDKVRHKCLDERRKPVNEQQGAMHPVPAVFEMV